jgi:O-succinylbenzoic acid--CoA ligase
LPYDDKWLRTGDIGYLDDEGYLYVLDRRDDLIISGGENIYPADVEAVLLAHPAVAEAGVVGTPDPEWGQTVLAAVKLQPGASPSADDLISFCRERLAGYKIPRHIRFVEAIPRNAAGKIVRATLRETPPLSIETTHSRSADQPNMRSADREENRSADRRVR